MPRFFSLCIFVSDGFRLESLKGDRSVGVLIWLRATVEDVVFRCGLSARFQIDLRARARWVFVGGYSGQDIWWGSNDAPAGLHDLRVSFSDRRTEASRDTRGQFCKKSTFPVYAVDSTEYMCPRCFWSRTASKSECTGWIPKLSRDDERFCDVLRARGYTEHSIRWGSSRNFPFRQFARCKFKTSVASWQAGRRVPPHLAERWGRAFPAAPEAFFFEREHFERLGCSFVDECGQGEKCRTLVWRPEE